MNKHELCIGNYFQVEKNNKLSICRIKSIMRSLIGVRYLDNSTDNVKIDKLIPISITEDLLETLNFSRNKSNGEVIFEKVISGFNITVDNTFNSYKEEWHVHIDDNDFDSCGNINVRYLHQLQNFIYQVTKIFVE